MKKQKYLPADQFQRTQVETPYEKLFASIFGVANDVRAGSVPLPAFRKNLVRVLDILWKAAARNVHGDAAHQAAIVGRLMGARDAAKRARTKDEATQAALTGLIASNFLFLGRLPANSEKAKAGWKTKLKLGEYRTLFYVRLPEQRFKEMQHYAHFVGWADHETSLFKRVMDIRDRHPENYMAALEEIREKEPALFSRFNRTD